MENKKLQSDKYLTEQITEQEVKAWTDESKKVVLDCPTGMGKTTLINQTVAKVASNRNALVLFLSSRTALTEQQKRNLKLLGVNNVDVRTYQWIENRLKNDLDLPTYAFVVSDEAHYFTNDSVFNNDTAISYKWIEQQPAVIYMSATGYTIFNFMKENEAVDINYYADGDYSKVSAITFCHSDEHMIECIEDIYNSEEKGIVFMDKMVRNGELGTRVHTPIMQWYLDHQEDSHFICSKGRKQFEEINEFDTAIVDGRFEKQFLFTTQALEVGIDITDTECKHIMVEMFDYDSVLQCLGRIRNKDGVHYYIRVYDSQTLNGKAKVVKDDFIDKAKEFDTLDWDARWDYCMNGTKFNSNKGLFYIDIFDDKRIKVNELMRYKYEDIYSQCRACIDGIGEGYEQLNDNLHISRLMHDFNEMNFKGEYIDMAELDKQKRFNEISEYLESLVDLKLNKNAQRELIDLLNVRVDGKQKKTVKPINSWLMENGFNYVIKSKQARVNGGKPTVWIINKLVE